MLFAEWAKAHAYKYRDVQGGKWEDGKVQSGSVRWNCSAWERGEICWKAADSLWASIGGVWRS